MNTRILIKQRQSLFGDAANCPSIILFIPLILSKLRWAASIKGMVTAQVFATTSAAKFWHEGTGARRLFRQSPRNESIAATMPYPAKHMSDCKTAWLPKPRHRLVIRPSATLRYGTSEKLT
jgi:hypothetical protein